MQAQQSVIGHSIHLAMTIRGQTGVVRRGAQATDVGRAELGGLIASVVDRKARLPRGEDAA